MKCMMMTAVGAPDVLALRDAPVPQPGAREVRVRLKAAGVNPVDTKLRSRGTYYPEGLPAILGCDGAGVVESIGPEVTRFRQGDEVYFCSGGIGGAPGTYAQYAVVHEDYTAHKPRRLSFHEAAALPLVLITAWESLHDRARIAAGDEVLVHAGAGGVGHVAIQLARLAGARVCTTIRGAERARFAAELGAERCIDHAAEDFVAAVNAWSEHGGARIVFDTVGSATFARSFGATRYGGDVVTLLQPDANVEWKVARNRNLRVSFELMLTPMFQDLPAARVHQAQILEQGARLADAGQLRVHVSHVLPLADAARAHRLIEAGHMQGKVVLDTES
jgi:NADPH2:quinone reductase